MDLFSQLDEPINILPQDGVTHYYGELFGFEEANNYLQYLLTNIEWKHDEAVILGKHITTKRKVAWYAEHAFKYTYSHTTKIALPWTQELLSIKASVEERTGERFNACLLNLYHDGSEGMAWHSDGEIDLKKNGAIASVSLGAARKFSFKHKQTKQNVSLVLDHGSLLVMKEHTQQFWLHRLPPTTKVSNPRVNLTFRTIVSER